MALFGGKDQPQVINVIIFGPVFLHEPPPQHGGRDVQSNQSNDVMGGSQLM
jgi:hypothetical protein